MLSEYDLERLIAVKRREIKREKVALGLLPAQHISEDQDNGRSVRVNKRVSIEEKSVHNHDRKAEDSTDPNGEEARDEATIPPDLDRYIRRYLGLPIMLKAGEYSPNNPLVRGERPAGDALLGLGEYERHRNTLRKLRQQQYREYLDEQAKKKQEAKEQAKRERREREERERQREEEEERTRRLQEQKRDSPEHRRASVCYVPSVTSGTISSYRSKVDTGVQVDVSKPLSVAVQTDDAEFFHLSPSPSKSQLTQAERELSPRTVTHADERPLQPAWETSGWETSSRRRSYGDYDERTSSISKRSNREKLMSDLRHSYMPSILDADAIQMRNVKAEKEAAARRQFYQQELKNQILEQQRIREERKTREKMLEAAEMRRLEAQLCALRTAQDSQRDTDSRLTAKMKENATDYEKKRTILQKDIDFEQQKLLRSRSQPSHLNAKRYTVTSHSDTTHMKPPHHLPRSYDRLHERERDNRLPYSTNIPDNSIFSPNYDVDSYLRKNLNPTKESLMSNRIDTSKTDYIERIGDVEKRLVVEKEIVHDRPKGKTKVFETYEHNSDETPIPVLRHLPKNEEIVENVSDVSTAMRVVEDKWKVPAVQKNILKSLPNDEGKNVSILTQLGSIRRQLQLEQLKLDNLLPKPDG